MDARRKKLNADVAVIERMTWVLLICAWRSWVGKGGGAGGGVAGVEEGGGLEGKGREGNKEGRGGRGSFRRLLET